MPVINTNCLHDGAVYETIEIDQIDFNEANDYEPTNIEELAEDIKNNGLLHNIVVVKKDDGRYKLLAGERRLRAIKLLAEQEPENWKSVTALVYSGLTSRQEEIIMDSSNLHARSAGGNEVQLRKATNRYMDNIKTEYGLNEIEALKATTEIYNGSGNTIRANRKNEQDLNEGLKAIREKAESVLQEICATNAITDSESAAKAVYHWICKNVDYVDVGGNTSEDVYPYNSLYSAIVDQKAICGGYAKLFCFLMSCLGYESGYCTGYSPSGQYHAWNAVQIVEMTAFYDATYGSGYFLKSKFCAKESLDSRKLKNICCYRLSHLKLAPLLDQDRGDFIF